MFKEATYDSPPSTKDFDYVAKKRRRTNDNASSSVVAPTPAIHLKLSST